MKKWILRILLGLLILIVIAAAGGFIYFNTMLPNVGPAPDINIEVTEDRVERGRYFAEIASACVHCHGTIAEDVFAQPLIEGTEGGGGRKFELPFGTVFTPNLTPYALKDWTDGEIFRAVTAGVNKDGEALFPLMPYHQYAYLNDEDIYDIIAYLRSLEPIENDVPDTEYKFPFNLIVKTIPRDKEPVEKPEPGPTAEWGAYMIRASACYDCHTPMDDRGNFLEGMDFAGGMEFPLPTGGIVRSANITPDEETGIGKLTEDEFVHRFKKYADSSYVDKKIGPGEFNTEMPWKSYAHLKENDLKAIYQYLRTLEPIQNSIVKFAPPEDLDDGEMSMN